MGASAIGVGAAYHSEKFCRQREVCSKIPQGAPASGEHNFSQLLERLRQRVASPRVGKTPKANEVSQPRKLFNRGIQTSAQGRRQGRSVTQHYLTATALMTTALDGLMTFSTGFRAIVFAVLVDGIFK